MIKIKKIFIYAFSTLFILAVLFSVFLYFFLDDVIDTRLQKLISKKFGTFYALEYESIEKNIGLTEISFIVNKASFSSDTTDHEGMAKFPTFFFDSKSLKVEKISTWNVIIGSSLDLSHIILEEPNLRIYTDKKDSNSNSDVRNKRGKSILSSLTIDRFLIRKGNVEIIDFQSSISTFESSSILIDVSGISLDLTHLNNYKKFLSFQDIIIESKTPRFTPLNGFYTYKMRSMNLSSENQHLSFNEIDIKTKQSLKEASKDVINHKELVNINIETINIDAVDLKKVIFETEVEVGKIDIENAYIHIFKNNRKHIESDFEKSVFNKIIRSIPIPIKVDTIQLNNVDVDFELMNSAHNQAAKVNLFINDGYISNFNTNINTQDTLTLFAEGKFMKKGDLWITSHILVSDTANNYQQFMGSIKNMPFNVLNPLIQQFANADISSGYVNELTFHGTANSQVTSGSIIFKYTDLEVEFLKKDHRKRFYIVSELINASTHKNNPNRKGELIGAHFTYHKKRWQGSVGMWIGGIIDGIFKTVVKDLPKEIIEKEKENKKEEKGIFHHKKKEKDGEKKSLFHLKKKEREHHKGLHLFHRKEKPKEKNKLFHHNKKQNQ